MPSDFVLAECGIRQLHSRYVDAVWRKDVEAFGTCFAEDCEWRVGGRVLRGREDVKRFISGAFPIYERIFMTFRTPILHMGQGEVLGRTYVTETSRFADGKPFAPIGIYFERFVQQGGAWRFKWRMFQTNYAGGPLYDEPFFDLPDYGPPPGMPPLDEKTIDRSGTGAIAGGAIE